MVSGSGTNYAQRGTNAYRVKNSAMSAGTMAVNSAHMQKFDWFKIIFMKISGANSVKYVSVIL